MPRADLRLLAVITALAVLGAFAGTAAARKGDAIRDRYIVTVRGGVDPQGVAREQGHSPAAKEVYRRALNGFVVTMTAGRAAALARVAHVTAVIPDREVGADTTIAAASWGLDRIDQRALPLDGTYSYVTAGSGVSAYVIDTGIYAEHALFGGRVAGGTTLVDDGTGTGDCNGHGTHVAGTIGADTYGVAPAVSLIPVRVLDCAGSGSLSDVLAGVEWAIADHKPGALAVANLSLGTGVVVSQLDDAVNALVADGVAVAVAAGNSGVDACGTSPGSATAPLTVGATTSTDARAPYSNWGPCLDLFAPGSNIRSTWIGGTTETAVLSGTSMAAPHVTGAAARLWSGQPSATALGVMDQLLIDATPDVVTDARTGSPNRLLWLVGDGTSTIVERPMAPAPADPVEPAAAVAPAPIVPKTPRITSAKHVEGWFELKLRGSGGRFQVFRDGNLLLETSKSTVLVRHGRDRRDVFRVRVHGAEAYSAFSNPVVRVGTRLRVVR